jgi:DNA polymerase I-like protein with 3'-5' exonuclease and polymerase domains
VTKREREVGKVAVLNLTYGGGIGVLIRKAAEHGVVLTPAEATVIVREFFTLFKEIRRWQDRQHQAMRLGDVIRSPLGREWRIPADNWHQMNEGLNAPIQSTASDLMLMGLDRAWPLIEAQGQVMDVVHDSVEILVPKGTFNEAAWRAIARTIVSIDSRFPMKIDISYGSSWGELGDPLTVGGEDG